MALPRATRLPFKLIALIAVAGNCLLSKLVANANAFAPSAAAT